MASFCTDCKTPNDCDAASGCLKSRAITNNPPRATLELSQEEAELMLMNCDSNIRLGLSLMQGDVMNRDNLEKLVHYNEFFGKIRTSLMNQGIRNPTDAMDS